MNKIFYRIKRIFCFDQRQTSFSINNNFNVNRILKSIISKLHEEYKEYKFSRIKYDDSILIDCNFKSRIAFSVFLEKTNLDHVNEITIVSRDLFDMKEVTNHILSIFDMHSEENLEESPILSNDERYIGVSYERVCIDGLYHDVYTLTTLMKG